MASRIVTWDDCKNPAELLSLYRCRVCGCVSHGTPEAHSLPFSDEDEPLVDPCWDNHWPSDRPNMHGHRLLRLFSLAALDWRSEWLHSVYGFFDSDEGRNLIIRCSDHQSNGDLDNHFVEGGRALHLIDDILGNPFAPLRLPLSYVGPEESNDASLQTDDMEALEARLIERGWLVCSWLTETVKGIAARIDAEADPRTHVLDRQGLAVLSDALEDAGCDDVFILEHLRGKQGCSACEGAGIVYDTEALSSRRDCRVCSGTGLVERNSCVRGCHVLELFLDREEAT